MRGERGGPVSRRVLVSRRGPASRPVPDCRLGQGRAWGEVCEMCEVGEGRFGLFGEVWEGLEAGY